MPCWSRCALWHSGLLILLLVLLLLFDLLLPQFGVIENIVRVGKFFFSFATEAVVIEGIAHLAFAHYLDEEQVDFRANPTDDVYMICQFVAWKETDVLQGFEICNESFKTDIGFGERLKDVLAYRQEF